MPLWLLATMVAVGLAAVWVAMRLMGFSRELVLDAATARAEWLADNPFSDPQEITLAADGKAALVRTSQGLGVIWVMGLDTATHLLDRATLRPGPGGLFIALHDFAAPGILVALTAEEAALWQAMIEKAA